MALLILLGTASIAYFVSEDRLRAFDVPENTHVHLASEALDEAVSRSIQHMRSLAFSEISVQRVINAGAGNAGPMEEAFTTLLSRNPSYEQMRWIGNDGMELVRVVRTDDGRIRILPKQDLQDKSGRYYVTDILRRKRGEIYISPLDLNIEHGRIEVPYHPMLRVGARVFRSEGSPVGMFVLNISARTMLNKFAERSLGSDVVLLNADGYWLKSPQPEDEWGFMFHRKETFGQRYPRMWHRISVIDDGQAREGNGLWTWRTVRFTSEDMRNVTPVVWKVVSHVSSTRLAEVRNAVWLQAGLGGVVLLVLFGWAVWQLARETEARLWAEEGLKHERAFLAQANGQLAAEIEERRSAQAKLEHSNSELQVSDNVLNNITEGVMRTAPDGTILSVNPACCVLTGYQADELVGKNPKLLKSGRHDAKFYEGMWRAVERDGYWQGEIWNRRKDGSLALYRETITAIRDHQGVLQYYVAVQTDITESKKIEETIRHQAYYDALTDLPNRILLMDRIRQQMAYANRYGKLLAVMFIDLDGFKAVNDTFGHDAGDVVLKETATRLTSCVRESDTLARLGGDEFVVVLNAIGGPANAATVAQKMLDALVRPFDLPDGQIGRLSASIGIAFYPGDGEDDQQVLNAADEAMYVAKQRGKAAYAFARPEQD